MDTLVFSHGDQGTSQDKIGHDALSFSYDHHPDCDKAYPTDDVTNLPENFVCNESETHGVLPDVRVCLQDEKADGVPFVERHEDCFEDHFFPDADPPPFQDPSTILDSNVLSPIGDNLLPVAPPPPPDIDFGFSSDFGPPLVPAAPLDFGPPLAPSDFGSMDFGFTPSFGY
jgi:hypothetical protein